MNKRYFWVITGLIFFLFSVRCLAEEAILYQISGLNESMLNNAKARLDVLLESIEKPITSEKINEFSEKAPENIQAAVQPFGYFHAKISRDITTKNSQTYF